jgi:hypothetical protein
MIRRDDAKIIRPVEPPQSVSFEGPLQLAVLGCFGIKEPFPPLNQAARTRKPSKIRDVNSSRRHEVLAATLMLACTE